MASVNKVILVGNVGKDCEVKNGVAKFSMATTEKYNGEEKTTWHNIVAFKKLAEICGDYVKKGMSVFIEGKISVSNWEDKEGNKRTSTEIIAFSMQMLGNKPSAETKPEEVAEALGGTVEANGVPDDF